MNEYRGVAHTRRKFLGLAIGLLTAGCAPAIAPPNGSKIATSSCTGQKAAKFPDGDPWGWDSRWATQLDKLGKFIMQAKNPYCQIPGGSGTLCSTNPDDATAWPYQLTDESTWKVLTEFDF